MTQKTLGYTELEWTCPKCKTRNPGTVRACTGCGAPQPEDVQFEQAGRQELVTDEAKIEAAKKGADIHCPYCKARNPAGTEVCIQCGGDLKEGLRRESGKVVGAYQAPSAAVKEIACPSCAAPNPETGKVCIKCGARLDKPAEVAAPCRGGGAQAQPHDDHPGGDRGGDPGGGLPGIPDRQDDPAAGYDRQRGERALDARHPHPGAGGRAAPGFHRRDPGGGGSWAVRAALPPHAGHAGGELERGVRHAVHQGHGQRAGRGGAGLPVRGVRGLLRVHRRGDAGGGPGGACRART